VLNQGARINERLQTLQLRAPAERTGLEASLATSTSNIERIVALVSKVEIEAARPVAAGPKALTS
jgi:hypothetical protein